jgi:hypothetical protein
MAYSLLSFPMFVTFTMTTGVSSTPMPLLHVVVL